MRTTTRLGYKTVRQKKDYPVLSGQELYRAKLYAKFHGYHGERGGWIYRDDGQHVAHGWGNFYYDHVGKNIIENWYTSIYKRSPK